MGAVSSGSGGGASSTPDPCDPTLLQLLRGCPAPPFRVRVRVALDLLADLMTAEAVMLAPRLPSSRLRIEHVRVAGTGVARIQGEGDLTGGALLVWEVLLAMPLARDGAGVPANARASLEQENADVYELLDRVLKSASDVSRPDQLFDALALATQGGVASHEDVHAALGLSAWGQPERAGVHEPRVDRQAAAWRSIAAKAVSKRGARPASRDSVVAPRPEPPSPAPTPVSPMPTVPSLPSRSLPTPPSSRIPDPPAAPASAPAAPAEAPPSTMAPRPAPSASAGVVRRGFVVVHADATERHKLVAALRSVGHRTVDFADADSAFADAAAAPPLGIVADFDLRPQNGDDLARRVRAHPGPLADTPFVLLVSPTATRARISPFANGADVKLVKPVLPEDLASEIGRLVALAPLLRAARAALPRLSGPIDAGLRGNFRALPIDALLGVLELERRTGLLRASTAGGTLCLELRSGLLVRGSIRGEVVPALDALRAMTALSEGAFTIYALPPKSIPQDAVPPHVLLMSARAGAPADSDAAPSTSVRRR